MLHINLPDRHSHQQVPDEGVPLHVEETPIISDRGYQTILQQLGILTQPTMDVSDASTYTGISKSHLHKLAREGRIPSTKPGGRQGKRYFTRFNLDAYMASNPSTPADGGAA